jgi:hypothetical protein
MFKIRIIPIFIICSILAGCKKENGKHDYEMRLAFDSGDVFTESGKIQEKKLERRKGQELYVDVFNGYTFLKVKDNKFICADKLFLRSSSPVNFAGGQTGAINGDIYFEGNYTQKGRKYIVENGTFEFIWRNEVTGASVDNQVHKGRWTLKRK